MKASIIIRTKKLRLMPFNDPQIIKVNGEPKVVVAIEQAISKEIIPAKEDPTLEVVINNTNINTGKKAIIHLT